MDGSQYVKELDLVLKASKHEFIFVSVTCKLHIH